MPSGNLPIIVNANNPGAVPVRQSTNPSAPPVDVLTYAQNPGAMQVRISTSLDAMPVRVMSGNLGLLFRYTAGDSISALGATFSRSSTATYVDANGIIQTASSGTIRDGHYILGARTLLLEGQRTNLLLRSQEFDNASWTLSGATVTANDTTAPDGTATADKLTDSAVAGAHLISQPLTTVSGTTYAFSCFLRAGASSLAYLRISSSASVNNYVVAIVNLSSGVVTQTAVGSTSGTLVSSSVTPLGGGWYRMALVGSVAVTDGTASVGFAPAATGNTFNTFGRPADYAGTGSNTIYVWGAQWEAGAFASSYISTAGSTVTRAADSYSDTQQAASETLTQYDRYYDQATAAWVDLLATITAGSNYPNQPTNFRAYRYRVVASGTRDLAWFQGQGFI